MDAASSRPERRRRLSGSVRRQLVSFEPRLSLALLVAGLLPPLTADSLRLWSLRAGGIAIGDNTFIAGRLTLAGGRRPSSRLVIGTACVLNEDCRFDVVAPVTLGNHVYVGHEVAVITAGHELGPSSQRAGATTAKPVTIGDGCWIGARATILGGVVIGDGSVVAAGAVVTQSVPPNTLVGGVPARVIRHLEP